MGKMFTFDIALIKGHSLVTSGPYNVVRHPSYTVVILGMAGYGLFLTSPDGVYDACMRPGHPWIYFFYILTYALSFVVITSLFVQRTTQEDKLLRGKFGAKWDRWAENVPYKLVPYVY